MPKARSSALALCAALLSATSACVSAPIALETRLPVRPPTPVYKLYDVPVRVVATDLMMVRKVEQTGLVPLGFAYRWQFALGPEVASGLEQSLRLTFEEVELRDAPPQVTESPALYLEPQIRSFDIGAFSLRTDVVLVYRLLDNQGRVLREGSVEGRSSFRSLQLAALFTGFLFPAPALRDSVERALQDAYTQLLAQLDELQAAGLLPEVPDAS